MIDKDTYELWRHAEETSYMHILKRLNDLQQELSAQGLSGDLELYIDREDFDKLSKLLASYEVTSRGGYSQIRVAGPTGYIYILSDGNKLTDNTYFDLGPEPVTPLTYDVSASGRKTQKEICWGCYSGYCKEHRP